MKKLALFLLLVVPGCAGVHSIDDAINRTVGEPTASEKKQKRIQFKHPVAASGSWMVSAPFDTVWSAMLDLAISSGWQMQVVDKNSGLITTQLQSNIANSILLQRLESGRVKIKFTSRIESNSYEFDHLANDQLADHAQMGADFLQQSTEIHKINISKRLEKLDPAMVSE